MLILFIQMHSLHNCQNELVVVLSITVHSVTIMPYLCRAFSALHVGFFFLRCIHLSCFLAVVGLHCCSWALQLQCADFSLWCLLLRNMGSRAGSFSSCCVWAQQLVLTGSGVHGLSCSVACGISSDQGSYPCLLCLASGFFTTEPPGKPCNTCYFYYFNLLD